MSADKLADYLGDYANSGTGQALKGDEAGWCYVEYGVLIIQRSKYSMTAYAESWNAIFKKKLIHLRVRRNPGQVHQAAFEYIEVYYNRRRIQKELGYLSPVEFEEEIDIGHAFAA